MREFHTWMLFALEFMSAAFLLLAVILLRVIVERDRLRKELREMRGRCDELFNALHSQTAELQKLRDVFTFKPSRGVMDARDRDVIV